MTIAREIEGAQRQQPVAGDGRRVPRVGINVRVGIDTDSNFYLGCSENVSEGGLFVATYEECPLGTEVTLRFTMPGTQRLLIVTGVVRWIRTQQEAEDMPPGLGIEFVSISPEVAALIGRYVRARAPMFYAH